MKRRIILALLTALLLLASSGYKSWLPLVANDTADKRGVGLWLNDPSACRVLDLLGVTWYYTGPQCPGYERVEYLASAIAFDRLPTRYTLIFNEPDLAHLSVEAMVSLFVPYAARWTDVIWVGPCPAYGPDLFAQFWRGYELRTGQAMPRERVRACMHCYRSAAECAVKLEQYKAAGYLVWVTEFGRPLSLDLTLRQQAEDTRQIVAMLEADPMVERYAYWPGVVAYGNEVPFYGLFQWSPLAVPLVGWDQRTIAGYALTWAGLVYADGG